MLVRYCLTNTSSTFQHSQLPIRKLIGFASKTAQSLSMSNAAVPSKGGNPVALVVVLEDGDTQNNKQFDLVDLVVRPVLASRVAGSEEGSLAEVEDSEVASVAIEVVGSVIEVEGLVIEALVAEVVLDIKALVGLEAEVGMPMVLLHLMRPVVQVAVAVVVAVAGMVVTQMGPARLITAIGMDTAEALQPKVPDMTAVIREEV